MLLDTVITNSSAHLTDLFHEAETIDHTLVGSQTTLSQELHYADASGNHLTASLAGLRTHIDQDQATLSHDLVDLIQGLEEFQAALGPHYALIDQAMNEAEAELQALRTQVETLEHEVQASLEHFQQSFHALEAQSTRLQQDVEAGVHRVSDLLQGTITPEIQAQQQWVNNCIADFEAFLRDQCLHSIDQATQEFGQHLEGLVVQLDTTLKERSNEVAQRSQATVSQMHNEHTTTLSGLLETATGLSQNLGHICKSVSEMSSTVNTAKDGVAVGVDACTVGIRTVIGIIQELEKLFGHILARSEK